ncbi:hypothetical protein Pfo_009786 [Paulownia fortunei]|nr:hypothetical protein Pfo_009786 [Paulownia fortunei]
MDCPTPHSHSLNPYSRTLLQNPTNDINQRTRKKAMGKFQEVIFKLAETHPNAPLTPARRSHLQDRLNHFVSQYKTPDHPPYSAMIERALRELNEKGGSSEDSISQFLEKGYDNLPWAHSVLLKHHLGKLCESGDIVETRGKRYMLAAENPSLNSSTKVKRKPPRRKKWRWDWERERNRQRKKKLVKKRNQQKGEKVEANEKHQEYDEKEQQLTENGVHSEDKQVKEDQTKRLLSCVGENGVCGDPSFLLTELPGMTAANEKKYPEEVRSRQQQIGSSEIMKADIWAAGTQEQQEREQSEYSQPELSTPGRPLGFELIRVENLPHLGSTQLELASAEEFSESKRTQRQLRRWSRRFPEPKAVTTTSVELATSPKPEEYHSLQLEHSNLEMPQDQQKALDSTPVSVEQMHHEKQQSELLKADVVEVVQSVMNGTKLKGDEKYGRRRKTKSKQSESIVIDVSMKPEEQPTELQREHLLEPFTTIDSPNLCLTSNQPEFALSNEQEPKGLLQQPTPQHEEIFQGKQLRRSLRACPAKPVVAKDSNFVGLLRQQHCPEECPKTVYRLRGRVSKQKAVKQLPLEPIKAACMDELPHQLELEQPPKCQRRRRLLKPKPDATDVENLTDVDDYSGQDLQQSGKPADCTSLREKMEALITKEVLLISNSKQKLQEEQPKKLQLGRLPKHRTSRSPKDKMKSPEIEGSNARDTLDQSKCQRTGKPPKHQGRGIPAKPKAS